MITHYFPGQHSDETVLYEVRPHALALYIRVAVLLITAVLLATLSFLFASVSPLAPMIGISIALLVALVGTFVTVTLHNKSVAYLTDRRIIRFEAHNPMFTSTRALSWDDAMKVKSYPPNLFWSLLNIGTLVVHARASTTSYTQENIQREIAGDDLELKDIWYYQDLGNYIEKIIHTNKKNPEELTSFRPFVPKPRGQRY